ncbi:7-cyano-7-deazaguanine synthase QueC [Mesorhizobium sp.]|uniref:7-cyano-7-deazaguanine synthase QueC n=1 Tax=Mesorhizobium sp. TaxID=1871066 RepID=UPI000FE9E085|nr:7-cyano-7-deazaguanine synthase QueC [Mesorhizobium sp.]RWO54263.1 MAG: 7-cyano-7-deazaguanine synthase QueC [Mesorhizobium sp.]
MSDATALVLFSGGQDSATCLAWALDRFEHVETIGFDYRQRHRAELDTRSEFRSGLEHDFPKWAGKLGEDRVLDLSVLGEISETALTRDVEIATTESGLPNTFVPGRNIIFLTFAAAVAYRRGLKHVVTGVCETDFSGYPDCRDDTVKALQVALNLGMESRFVLETPLMWIDKAQTWDLAERLGGTPLVDLIRERTLTCYHGDIETTHQWGRGCGVCPACGLRAQGWKRFRSRKLVQDCP